MTCARALFVCVAIAVQLPVATAHARDGHRVWSRDFQVGVQPTVRIDARDARVTVRPGPSSEVTVRVEAEWESKGLVFGRVEPEVHIERSGDEVRVNARYRGSSAGIFVFSSRRLSVDVTVPAKANLAIVNGDGSVRAEDVAGDIRIRVSDGSVTGRRLQGSIEVRSHDGRVVLEDLDGSLRLETNDGSSQIHGRFDRLFAESQDGTITASVSPGSRIDSAGWSLRSADGGIHLALPRDLKATIDATAQDGRVTLKLPVHVQGRARRNDVVADLNGGGAVLRLRSVDGSIRVGPGE